MVKTITLSSSEQSAASLSSNNNLEDSQNKADAVKQAMVKNLMSKCERLRKLYLDTKSDNEIPTSKVEMVSNLDDKVTEDNEKIATLQKQLQTTEEKLKKLVDFCENEKCSHELQTQYLAAKLTEEKNLSFALIKEVAQLQMSNDNLSNINSKNNKLITELDAKITEMTGVIESQFNTINDLKAQVRMQVHCIENIKQQKFNSKEFRAPNKAEVDVNFNVNLRKQLSNAAAMQSALFKLQQSEETIFHWRRLSDLLTDEIKVTQREAHSLRKLLSSGQEQIKYVLSQNNKLVKLLDRTKSAMCKVCTDTVDHNTEQNEYISKWYMELLQMKSEFVEETELAKEVTEAMYHRKDGEGKCGERDGSDCIWAQKCKIVMQVYFAVMKKWRASLNTLVDSFDIIKSRSTLEAAMKSEPFTSLFKTTE